MVDVRLLTGRQTRSWNIKYNISVQEHSIYYTYTTQLDQLIGQCRSRHTLSFIIEETRVVEDK